VQRVAAAAAVAGKALWQPDLITTDALS
jgi:hypothetical protein